MLKHIIFIIILVGGGYYFWTSRPVTHGPGVVAPDEPTQKEAYGIRPIDFKSYDIQPLASFNIEARVLSKKRYADRFAEVAPYDFVLGWGPMSDERNLDKMLIKQDDRYFDWEMTSRPIPQTQMIKYSTNVHMAPSTEAILQELHKVRQGHVVRITGYLVQIESTENSWSIKSSLRRDDYGKDASEVIWIEDFKIL